MKKLHSLQALRAIAALLVVADHALTLPVGTAYPEQPITSYAWFLGEQGVAIFFIISGFIMVTTTYNLPPTISTSWNFLKRRFLRVAPLYWLYTAAACALIATGLWNRPFPITAARVVKSVFFIPYLDGPGAMRPILGPGWTLNYEMGFYVAFSLLLILPARLAVAALTTLFSLLVAIGVANHQGSYFSEPQNIYEFWTSPIILLFAAGGCLGLLYKKINASLRANAVICAALLLSASLILFHTTHSFIQLDSPARFGYWAIDLAVVSVCVFSNNKKTIFEPLGDASYTLYLTHIFVLLFVAKAWRLMHLQQYSIALPLVAAAAAIPVALLAYRHVEKPMTEFLHRQAFARENPSKE